MYWNLTDRDRLIKALLLADNEKLMNDFLSDLLTEEEFKMLVNRLKVMCLLKDAAPYSSIRKITGFSETTISRISKKIRNWEGGFQSVIKKFTKSKRKYNE